MLRLLMSVVFALIFLANFYGCAPMGPQMSPRPVASQVPVPSSYALNTQQKMQAMYHWSVLAEQVAARIETVLENRVLNGRYPIFVAPAGTSPFEKNFHDLLITKLVNKNLPVANQSQEAMILSFDIDVVKHAKRIKRTNMGVYRSLAPGVFVQKDKIQGSNYPREALVNEYKLHAAEINVDSGMYTHFLPRTEIMITSSLRLSEQYIMRDSSIYYINEKEVAHYDQRVIHQPSGVINYEIVDK